jgi:transcriptional coactivator p15 (PC4)
MKRIVRDIKKNSREILRIELDEFRGHQLISARIWFRGGDVLKPTPKGLSVDIRHLAALREALDQAEKLAVQEGLL